MPVILAACFLAIWAIVFLLLSGSWLAPGVIMSAFWALVLSLIYASGDFFYPISDRTLFVIVLANFSFGIGATAVISLARLARGPNTVRKSLDRIPYSSALMFLLIGLALLPGYLLRLWAIANVSGIDNFLYGIRYQTAVVREGLGFGIWEYYIGYLLTAASISYCSVDSTRRSKWVAAMTIALAIAVSLSTASRLGVFTLLISLVAISALKHGRLRLQTLVLAGASSVASFAVIAVILEKGGSRSAAFWDNIVGISQSIQLYGLGGPVAFDRFIRGEIETQDGPLTFRFFSIVANSFLGTDFRVPDLIHGYVLTPRPTNVYSIFFAYYRDHGMIGVGLLFLLMGVVFGVVYAMTWRGSSLSYILYGLFVSGILLSTFDDMFLRASSVWIQTIVLVTIARMMPSLRTTGSSTAEPLQTTLREQPGECAADNDRHRRRNLRYWGSVR